MPSSNNGGGPVVITADDLVEPDEQYHPNNSSPNNTGIDFPKAWGLMIDEQRCWTRAAMHAGT